MKVIKFLLKGSVKQVLIAGIVSLAAAAFYILAIRSFSDVLEYVKGDTPYSFFMLAGLVLASALLAILASHYVTNHFEFKISGQRVTFSELVLKSTFDKIEKSKEKIVPTLFNDIITLATFAKGLPDFIVSFFTVVAIWGYMFFISWQFTLIFISVFFVSISMTLASQSYLFKEEKRAIEQRNVLHRRLNGLVDGLKELTLDINHKQVYATELIGESSNGFAKHTVNRNKVLIAVGKISESFILISLGLIFLIATYYFETGKDFFIEFFTLITFTLPSLIRIGLFFSTLKKAEVALEQIEGMDIVLKDFEEKETDADQKYFPNTQISDKPVIKLDNVHYTYITENEKSFTVGPFNLEIFKNEILLINGGNGSGKTTLIKLLTGLYIQSSGQVSFAGKAVNSTSLAEYRNIYSAVFADSFVFQDLSYINHNRVTELREKYLDLLEIRDKVDVENGIKLSTTSLSFGQKSRLNLFRSLLEDKEFYVFDEWAANQDPYFKNKFYTEIIPALKKDGNTVIIISHDDQFFEVADRRITVSQGQLLNH
jgi:putative ATP-binding cassette transporter